MIDKTQPEETEQKFNFGLDLLKRISQEFYVLEDALVYGDLTLAWNVLQSINNELDCFLNDKEKIMVNSIEDKINTKINACSNIDEVYYCAHRGIQNPFFKYPQQRTELKPLLVEFNRKFRSLMKEKGLYMPEKSESSLF